MHSFFLRLSSALIACCVFAGAAHAQAPTVSIESQEAAVGRSVSVPVQISGFDEIGAVSLIVTYDPEVLSFPDDADTEELIDGAPRDDFSANVTEPGELRISWFDATASDPISLENGPLLQLTFSSYSGGTGTISFDSESDIGDPEADSYNVTYEGGEVRSAADQIQTSVRRTFDTPSDSTSYELVALPGQADVDVAETLSGPQGTGWRAFREVGATNGGSAGLEAYDGSEAFAFEAGRGFWVISQSDWSFEGTVPAVVAGDGTPSIPLRDGWNAVSNPLQTDLSWASVQTASGLQEALWRWDGGWSQVQTFASATEGEAFYVFNGAGVDSLDLPTGTASADEAGRAEGRVSQTSFASRVQPRLRGPHPPSGPRSRRTARSESARSESDRPRRSAKSSSPRTLTLHVSVEGDTASSVTVGLSAEADDAQTYRAPPGHFSAATLHALGEAETPFARHIVPGGDSSQSFRLRLSGDAGTTVTLAAEGLAAWEGGAATLTDERSGATYDLHEQETIRLSLPEGDEPNVPLRLQVRPPSPRGG